ncbi:MAG TPA: twin-arginine translocase TatA/TatE family subunit [Ktedonobacterales bacterium]
MGFGHIGLIIVLLLVALVVFGPRRMIEMVTQLGKSLIQTRDALKEMHWSLSSDDENGNPPATTATSTEGERPRVVESAPLKRDPE